MVIRRFKRKGMKDAPTIQAIQLQQDTWAEAAVWVQGVVVREQDVEGDYHMGLNVNTIEGPLRAHEGDYVIKDVAGAVHVRTEGRFEYWYDEVEPVAELRDGASHEPVGLIYEDGIQHVHVNVREARLSRLAENKEQQDD